MINIGTDISITSIENDIVESSTLTQTVTGENLSGVAIQCSVFLTNPLSQILSKNATLVTYGTVVWYALLLSSYYLYTGPPKAVSNLITKPATLQSSSNALISSYGVLHALQYSYTTLSQCG